MRYCKNKFLINKVSTVLGFPSLWFECESGIKNNDIKSRYPNLITFVKVRNASDIWNSLLNKRYEIQKFVIVC